MIIQNVLNNNAVVARHQQREVIVVERGIGFRAKKDAKMALRDSMKVYVPEDQAKLKIATATIASLPSAYLDLAAGIIQEAEKRLQTTFNSYLLIELADHVHFAVQRLHEKIVLHNKLLWEIQVAYTQEYEMGEWALHQIAAQLHEQLPEDEAGFIALKFVSNDLNHQQTVNSLAFTQTLASLTKIIFYNLGLDMNVKTPDYQRLVIHLKFFLQRMYAAAPSPLSLKMENYDYVLLKHLQQDYARAYHCMEDVDRFMQQKLAIAIPKNEQIYLTMHIARLAKCLAE